MGARRGRAMSSGGETFLAYIDDSRDEKLSCFAAIIIRAADWLRLLDDVVEFRRALKLSDGIYVNKEFHATDFVAGRGNLGAVVTKFRRAQIFDETLDFIATRKRLRVMTACVPNALEERAFERMINRLNSGAEDRKPPANVMLISDEGKNYNRLVRKMRRFNFIHSKYGSWSSGKYSRNNPITRIVEDIVYRDSETSFFIQLADFCAFALLRSENPLRARSKYGLDKSFERLRPVLRIKSFAKDPRGLGIIREF
jgi:hypothetical protein